jgi:septal ring factor EnvC (AmiA/AmiB activator)
VADDGILKEKVAELKNELQDLQELSQQAASDQTELLPLLAAQQGIYRSLADSLGVASSIVRATDSDLRDSVQKIKALEQELMALKNGLEYSQSTIFPLRDHHERGRSSPGSDELTERFKQLANPAPSVVEAQRHVLFRRAKPLLPFLKSVDHLMPEEVKTQYAKLEEALT